ncbi:MAG: hypothetical protein AAGK97_08165, partial [Bacteroidota bacterium]
EAGEASDVLELNFKNVGNTPNNKYRVWVGKEDHLISQWSFYTNAEDEKARFVTPWKTYKDYNGLLLSGDRGENYTLSEIAVFDSLPTDLKNAFTVIE